MKTIETRTPLPRCLPLQNVQPGTVFVLDRDPRDVYLRVERGDIRPHPDRPNYVLVTSMADGVMYWIHPTTRVWPATDAELRFTTQRIGGAGGVGGGWGGGGGGGGQPVEMTDE